MISIKLQSNFIETTVRHGSSPGNLLHIFRKPFLKNTSGWLLLDYVMIHFICQIQPIVYYICNFNSIEEEPFYEQFYVMLQNSVLKKIDTTFEKLTITAETQDEDEDNSFFLIFKSIILFSIDTLRNIKKKTT